MISVFPYEVPLRPHRGDGCFIVFCGSDGMGKSTLIELLSNHLNYIKQDNLLTKLPSDYIRKYPPFVDFLCGNRDSYSYRAIAMVAMADRIQLCDKIVKPALELSKTVICDRYVYSGLARLAMHGDPCDSWFIDSCKFLAKPDIVFLVNASEKTVRARLEQRNYETHSELELKETLEMQEYLLKLAPFNDFQIIDTTYDQPEIVFNEQIIHYLTQKGKIL